MQKVFGKCLIAAVFLLTAVTVFAQSTDLFSGKNKWKVYAFNGSHNHLSSKIAASTATGTGVTFTFPSTPDTAYLLTSPNSSLADLTTKTLSAGIQVNGSGAFISYGNCGGTPPPSVRFFFQTSATGSFDPTNYWWSIPGSAALTPGMNATITTALNPSLWLDYNGEHADGSTALTTAFIAAAQNMASIGLSFGGCSGYANGVGVPSGGPDSFILSSFTIQ